MAAPMKTISCHLKLRRTALNLLTRHRYFSTTNRKEKGLVLGVYEGDDEILLTKATEKFDNKVNKKLTNGIQLVKKKLKKGKSRTFYGLDAEFSTVTAVCIGKKGIGYNELEGLDEGRDQIRIAVARAVRQLQDIGETEVEVDPCGDAEAAAEGSVLSLHSYDELKSEDKQKPQVKVKCYTQFSQDRDKTSDLWTRGVYLAEGQMFASKLMEMPANKLTPTIFSQIVSERLSNTKKVSVTVRDTEWIKSQKMESFLSVAKGSDEPPVFLEMEYKGTNSSNSPVALVGKGVTFDSGGISIKPSANMDMMRADMGGAACVAGSLLAVARLNLPIYIKAFIPLCENMPSGKATKPGDVVTARNGKTIQVDNTDAEGRLILADALCYADTFNPTAVLDMATLTVSTIADTFNPTAVLDMATLKVSRFVDTCNPTAVLDMATLTGKEVLLACNTTAVLDMAKLTGTVDMATLTGKKFVDTCNPIAVLDMATLTEFNPTAVLDMATLTGAIDVALGSAVTGVFSNSNTMWELLQKAGSRTGDRVWRMPLLQHYSKQVTESQLADVNNIGKYARSGGACTAAAFLKEFVTAKQWMHLDIAGVMMNQDEVPYLSKGMSGRPTRTVVEFLKLLSEQS
ncbi:LAP3 [Mytilus coruscus]|uniref:Cytosol aminopeptidase n=1 Tax=Mytilus coruscus TaxID=42192 RepID=A0A6J8EK18_MYTCO|nr:LAP3 [Mytilus coruscus]